MANRSEMVSVKRSALAEKCGEFVARQGAFVRTGSTVDSEDRFIHHLEQLVTMRIDGAVATIPFRGYVTPDDPWSLYYGETTLRGFVQNLLMAAANPTITTIIIDFNTPGGLIHGVEAAAKAVAEVSGKKRVIGYSDTQCCSAGYWVMSACGEVYIGSETTELGSIGVYMAHFDYSEAMKESGVTVTEIASGEFKGIASPYAPLTKDEKEALKAQCDYIFSRFVAFWATHREVSLEAAISVSNGLTYFGQTAVDNGLADGIKTYQEIMTMTAEEQKQIDDAKAQAATAQATAQAEAAARAKAEAALTAQTEELNRLRAAAESTAAVEAGAQADKLYQDTLGRLPTAEEKTAYVGSAPIVREAIATGLKAAATARNTAANTTNATGSVADDGLAPKEKTISPIAAAAKAMGISQ